MFWSIYSGRYAYAHGAALWQVRQEFERANAMLSKERSLDELLAPWKEGGVPKEAAISAAAPTEAAVPPAAAVPAESTE